MMVAHGGPRPKPGTLTQLFFDAVERHDKPDALQVKIGGRYEPISHRVMADRVRHVAHGLHKLGVQPGDRVAIVSENRPEWAIADYACLTARLTDVAVYPTLPAAQIAYILKDSGAVAVFVSTKEQAEKIAEIRTELPSLRYVIGFEEMHGITDMTFPQLEQTGRDGETAESILQYREEALRVQPDDLATLIYTSGTTGEPKGVMLTHDNLYSNVAAARHLIDFTGHDVGLSFLPLSHIFERMAGHYLMFDTGTSIAYAESIDAMPDNMLEVRPTFLVSVPRIYEKIYARVLESATAGGAAKKKIFQWARGVAHRCAAVRVQGKEPAGLLGLQYAIAKKLVFSKILDRTGGRIRYCVSGGAPLAPEINSFFYGAGLLVLEGYGLTETSPVISVNTPNAVCIATVGRPVDGVEVMIASDGEILTRGPHVMKGYFNKPEATAEAIDADGWFHTGDVGELRDGFLAITDRKKEIIVTAGGKNIAPQPIENRIRQNKYVTQAVMIGDKRKFPAVLVVPNFEQLEKWASYKQIHWTDRAQLITLPEVQNKMEREVFGQLADLAHFEMPKKVALLQHDLSLEQGEMTPTLKVKRRVVDERYKDVIDAIYM
jgi:long-chain acyl-CoA synthetase